MTASGLVLAALLSSQQQSVPPTPPDVPVRPAASGSEGQRQVEERERTSGDRPHTVGLGSQVSMSNRGAGGGGRFWLSDRLDLQFQPRPVLAPQWFPDSKAMLVFYGGGTLGRVDVESRQFTPLLPGVRVPIDLNQLYGVLARLSHDGRFLYYVPLDNPAAGRRRVVRLAMESGVTADVATVETRAISGLAVSSDDRQVAFIANTATAENPVGRSIMVVPADGGEPQTIHRTREVGIDHLVWSHDDRRLFYTSRFGRHLPDRVIDIGGDIWTVKVDGTDAKPLGIGLSDEYHLNIHPNGRQLIWMEENYRNELWLMEGAQDRGEVTLL